MSPQFSFLGERDGKRVERVLAKFEECGFRRFAFTGSMAIGLHCDDGRHFALNDLDFVVEDATALPPALGNAFLVGHFHPDVRRGRILIQLVDQIERLRIDVFTSLGCSFDRIARFSNGPAVLSKEDLAARLASILMDIDRGRPVDRKYLSAFERIAAIADASALPLAWAEQRKNDDPITFDLAVQRVRAAASARGELLCDTIYATSPGPLCSDCVSTEWFRCAPAAAVLPILGYC